MEAKYKQLQGDWRVLYCTYAEWLASSCTYKYVFFLFWILRYKFYSLYIYVIPQNQGKEYHGRYSGITHFWTQGEDSKHFQLNEWGGVSMPKHF